jgi:hypothetical protein
LTFLISLSREHQTLVVAWFYEVILYLFKSGLQGNAFNITHVKSSPVCLMLIDPVPVPQQGTAKAPDHWAAFLANIVQTPTKSSLN